MRDRLDRAVAAGIGLEIDRSVFRKIDLARLAVRPQELACVVAPRDRHRIEAERQEPVDRGADAGLGEIPGVGVNGLVAHRVVSGQKRLTNPLSFRRRIHFEDLCPRQSLRLSRSSTRRRPGAVSLQALPFAHGSLSGVQRRMLQVHQTGH